MLKIKVAFGQGFPLPTDNSSSTKAILEIIIPIFQDSKKHTLHLRFRECCKTKRSKRVLKKSKSSYKDISHISLSKGEKLKEYKEFNSDVNYNIVGNVIIMLFEIYSKKKRHLNTNWKTSILKYPQVYLFFRRMFFIFLLELLEEFLNPLTQRSPHLYQATQKCQAFLTQ